MSSIRKRAAVLAAVFAFVLGPAAIVVTASPAAAATYQYFGAESYNAASGASAFVQFNAAHSQYIVSIKSNYVNCPAFNGARVTWCGTVGNNTSHAQAGVNYTANGQAHYLRMDVWAPIVFGYLRCGTRGDDTSHFVTYCNGVAN